MCCAAARLRILFQRGAGCLHSIAGPAVPGPVTSPTEDPPMVRGIRVSDLARSLSLLMIAVLVAGCGQGVPTASELRPEGLRVGAVARPVVSSVAFDAGVYSGTIGPEGGVLEFGVGSLTFPAGAVADPTTITASVDGSNIGVEFSPHGLSFPPDARPSLSLDVPSDEMPRSSQIVYVDSEHIVLQVLETKFQIPSGSATARLDHFSPYILAQN